jgi:MFS family permease
MLILDVTVVAVALPNIAADLELGRQPLTWVVSGYTLAFGGLLLLGGRAADLFGARRLVIVGLALFAGASLLAGLAPTGWALLAGRVLQGLAAAILSPSALSLVVTMFEGTERDRALGIWSALGGGGAALGLLLGGSLTAGPGWPWGRVRGGRGRRGGAGLRRPELARPRRGRAPAAARRGGGRSGRSAHRLAGRRGRQHPGATVLRQIGLARPWPLHLPGADGDRHGPGPRPPVRARGGRPASTGGVGRCAR